MKIQFCQTGSNCCYEIIMGMGNEGVGADHKVNLPQKTPDVDGAVLVTSF